MRSILFSLLVLSATVSFGQKAALQDGLALKYLAQPPQGKQTQIPVIILLHGYGSNEQDLFGLKDMFPKNYLIIAVRAPMSLGGGGYEWYDFETVNGKHKANYKQIENSRALLEKFIRQVTDKYHADAKQVYVMGFSQGAVMSYEIGFRSPKLVKGIGVLSGMMQPALKAYLNKNNAPKALRIFISHGTADDRITFAEGKAAADYLKSIGLTPDFHTYNGMGHTISNEVMSDLLKWLR
jgi:phospholipase/carboxylesterase